MIRRLLLIFIVMLALPGAEDPGRDQLAALQTSVRNQLLELERSFVAIANAIAPTESERAARLLEALRASKEALLVQRMAETATALAAGRVEEAVKSQTRLAAEIRSMLALLTSDLAASTMEAEIRKLEEFQAQVRKLLGRQQELRRDNQGPQERAQALSALEQALARLNALRERQVSLNKETAAAAAQGAHALDKVAEAQKALHQDTQDAVKGVEGAAASAVGEAAKAQASASERLRDGRAAGAGRDQQQATASLDRAIAALKEERERILRLPDLPEEAAKERALAKDTERAMDGMGKDTPGREPMGEAAGNMQRAGQGLENRERQAASAAQDRAINDLNRALAEVDRRLAQLRDQMREERLSGLSATFRAMLERQRPVSGGTRAIESQRGQAGLAREQELKLMGYAGEEADLAGQAERAALILEADATTVIMPRLVRLLGGNLLAARDLLIATRSDSKVQDLQRSIESILQDLITALEEARQEPPPSSGNPPPQNQAPQQEQRNQPLVPKGAELKLARAAQLRINEQTAAADAQKTNPQRQADLGRLAEEQARVQAMVEEMAERLNREQTEARTRRRPGGDDDV